MKHLRLLLIVSATLLSSTVWADGSSDRLYGKMIQANEQSMREYASAQGKNPPEVTHYRYGMKLDIAKVIHVTSTNGNCDVMPAQMTYEDSSGNLHILEYRVSGTDCRSQHCALLTCCCRKSNFHVTLTLFCMWKYVRSAPGYARRASAYTQPHNEKSAKTSRAFMNNKALLGLSQIVLSISAAQAAMAAEEKGEGFIEGSSLSILNRNFYFNRDFRKGQSSSTGNGYSEEWAHGVIGRFESGSARPRTITPSSAAP